MIVLSSIFQQSLIGLRITYITLSKPDSYWIKVRLTQDKVHQTNKLHWFIFLFNQMNESSCKSQYCYSLIYFQKLYIYIFQNLISTAHRNRMQKNWENKILSGKSSLARTISDLQGLIDEISGLLTTYLNPDAAAFIHFDVRFPFLPPQQTHLWL